MRLGTKTENFCKGRILTIRATTDTAVLTVAEVNLKATVIVLILVMGFIK